MFSSDQDARPRWEEDAKEETSRATAPVQAVTDRKTRIPFPTAGEGPSSTINNDEESTSHDAPAINDETASHVEPAWDDRPTFDEQPNIYPIEQHAPSGPSYVLTYYVPYPVFSNEDTVNKPHPVYYPVVVHPPTSSPPFHTAYDQWNYSQWRYAQPRPELQVDATTGLQYATTSAQYRNPKRQNNSKADHNRTQKPGSMGHPKSQRSQYPRESQYPEHTHPQTQVNEAPPLSQPTPSRRRSFLDTRPIASMTGFVSRHISRSASPSKRPGSLAGSETSRQSEGGGQSRVGAGLKRQLSRLLRDKSDPEPSYPKLPSDGLLKPPSTSRPSRSPTPPHTPKNASSTPPAPWSARAESLQVVASDTPGILRLKNRKESEGWGVDRQPAQWDRIWSTAEAESNTRTPRPFDPQSPKPKSPKVPISLSSSTPSYSLKPPRAQADEDGWQTVRHSRSATLIMNLGKGKGKKELGKDLKASQSSETLQNERKKVLETEVGVRDMFPGAGDGKAESAGDGWRRSDADGQVSHQARSLEQDLDISGFNTQYVSEAHQESTTPKIASPRILTPALDDLASHSTNIVGDSPADIELQAPQIEDTIGNPDESTATNSENERDEQETDLMTVTTRARKEEEEDAGAEVLDEDNQDCDPSESRTEDRTFTTPKRKHPKKKTPKKNKKSQDLKPPPPFLDDDFLIPTPPRSPEHSPTLETLDADTPTKKTQGQKKREKEKLKRLQKTWDEEILKEKEGFYDDLRNRALTAYTYDHTNDSCWWYTDSNLPPSQPPAYYARRYIPRGTIFMWERPFMRVFCGRHGESSRDRLLAVLSLERCGECEGLGWIRQGGRLVAVGRHSQWKKWSEYVRCIEQEDWDGLQGQWGLHGDMTVGEPSSMLIDVVFRRSTFKYFEEIYAQRRENALDGPPLPNIVTPSKEDWATAREKRFMDMERFHNSNKVSAGQLKEPDTAGDEETLAEGEEEGTVGK
ncbi:hypothetical protein L202_05807 [Cryptococcus amylolentus CBS 6039]|uniref:Uncharacterized protein n=1 Tax=Cryptococcus amylolentus CBS 6039 TaxID=1295533 RepID=A0A1E3HI49_9TREE|nr:hypothetical protein L202_05807 [Cryptococcus amylolentus CBS 6039]ODN75805.1 hypothetical protein L202_05807 [Cryptococcus amylolentus CBS 6039]